MKQKELHVTKPFLMSSHWKSPMGSMVYTKIFQRCRVHPSRHKTWNQHWFTLAHRPRRWTNVKPTFIQRILPAGMYILANTRHWTNVSSMLARRLRRRPNIDPTLVQSIVFAGIPANRTYGPNGDPAQRWITVCDAGPTMSQHHIHH